MDFIVETIYRNDSGKQKKFILKSATKLEVVTDYDRLRFIFRSHTCKNAILVDNKNYCYLRGKGCKLHFVTLATDTISSFLDIYTGDNLKSLIQNSGVLQLERRDFVNEVISYARNDDKRLLGISGLRGTGKTTGFLQAISNIGYKRCAYLVVSSGVIVTCKDILDVIKTLDVKYVFIDEITRVIDFVSSSSVLYDSFTLSYNKKLFISGTESLCLIQSRGVGLYHRLIVRGITFINYAEAKRTMNLTLNEYIKIGGLYKANVFNDVYGLCEYISTSIVDNIQNTLKKNRSQNSNLRGISDEKLTRIVFLVFYTIIFKRLKSDINLNRVINLFDMSSNVYTSEYLSDLLKSRFGLSDTTPISDEEFNAVFGVLMQIGVVIRVENIWQTDDFQYCITNQCITNVLLRELIKVIQSEANLGTTTLSKEKGIKPIQGCLFESLVLAHAVAFMSKQSGDVYFYRDSKNREVDLIFDIDYDDEHYFCLYEIKMTDNVDIAVVKTTWLNDVNILEVLSNRGTIISRGIIYGGKNTIFRGFTNDVRGNNGLQPVEIETRNMNTNLISAEDFLLNIRKYSIDLFEKYISDNT